MRTVRLGKTDEVSRVGMGVIPIQRPPLEEAVKVIQRALDLGVDFIDTSIGYEDSQGARRRIHRDEALRRWKHQGRWARHRVRPPGRERGFS